MRSTKAFCKYISQLEERLALLDEWLNDLLKNYDKKDQIIEAKENLFLALEIFIVLVTRII